MLILRYLYEVLPSLVPTLVYPPKTHPPSSCFFFSPFPFFFLCVCVCVCVSRMYVRAYLAIPCVSANDDVKHTKSNIRYDNKINKMK